MLTVEKILAVSLLLACSGCSSLPSQGPTAADVLQEANYESHAADPRYLVANLDNRAAAVLAGEPVSTLVGTFGSAGRPSSPVIGIGDSVSVTVWEAAAGGLFSTASINGITAGSHSATIPEQVVGKDGSITVPYAGRILIAGDTTSRAETKIVAGLRGKAIEPQVLVNVSRTFSNTVTVTGEVTTGARVPISGKGDRILDVIATAGGIRAPVHEVFIVISRGNRSAKVPMQALLQRPSENIFVQPSDVLTVIREPQTFTAFGATGRNALVAFDAVGINLGEAIAKAGGLLDNQADAQGVFLLRSEPIRIARQLDPAYPIPPGANFVNVVYNINLRDAATYFLARDFVIRNKDIVYVASAPSTQLMKALQIFGAIASPAITGAAIIK